MVFARTNSSWVRMLVTRNSGRARGTSRRSVDAKASGFSMDVRTMNVADRLGANRALRVFRPERNVCGRPDGPADVDVARVANQSHDLHAGTAFTIAVSDRPADWIRAAEISPGKSFVDDGDMGVRVPGAEVSSVEKRNLHGLQPAGGDIQDPGSIFARAPAID